MRSRVRFGLVGECMVVVESKKGQNLLMLMDVILNTLT